MTQSVTRCAMKHLASTQDLRMRHVCLFVSAIAFFIGVTSVRALEASCDYRECMNICRNEYEPGCTGMCSRIISLCRQLVPKPERTRNARRSFSARENIKVNAQARSTPGRIN
jgi:hypothetical protein